MNSKKRNKSGAGERSSAVNWGIVTVALAIVLAIGWFWSSKSYPEVSSPDGLKLIRALYTACSSQNGKRLAQVEAELRAVEQKGRLTEAESMAFRQILEQARQGDWDQATDESYRFAQDQIR